MHNATNYHWTPMNQPVPISIGFSPSEIDIDSSTRSTRLKWVVVVTDSLPSGRAVNAFEKPSFTAQTLSLPSNVRR